ncbi:hypothetical protein WJX79_004917 [Trebouxia sp. C0005]
MRLQSEVCAPEGEGISMPPWPSSSSIGAAGQPLHSSHFNSWLSKACSCLNLLYLISSGYSWREIEQPDVYWMILTHVPIPPQVSSMQHALICNGSGRKWAHRVDRTAVVGRLITGLHPRWMTRSSCGLQRRMLSSASTHQKHIISRHGTHCFEHHKAAPHKPFRAHDPPVSDHMSWNTTKGTYQLKLLAKIPIYNPNYMKARIKGSLKVFFYDTEAGVTQVEQVFARPRALAKSPYMLELVVDASNVPSKYILTILSECATFPRRLIFFVKGSFGAHFLGQTQGLSPIDTYFMIDCINGGSVPPSAPSPPDLAHQEH